MEIGGWRFAAFDEELKSNGDDDVDVEKLSLNGGAKADGCVQVHQPCKQRATRVLGAASDPDVNQAA